MLVITPLRPSGPPLLEFLDVGQGDAILAREGARAFLVDTGDGRKDMFARAILPHLDRIGSPALEAIFLTHLDADHAGGAGAAARYAPAAPIYLPEGARGTRELNSFLREQGIAPARIRFLARGDTFTLAGFTIEVLWPPRQKERGGAAPTPPGSRTPDPSYRTSAPPLPRGCGEEEERNVTREVRRVRDPPAGGVEGGALHGNAGSLVLAVSRHGNSALLTGDLTAASEALLVRLGLPRATLLKASHHGAAGASTPAFLRAVSPETVVIPVGYPNRFGHPAPETVRTLCRTGAEILTTADRGLVRCAFTRKGVSIATSREP